MNNHPDKKETMKETFKRIFSLKEDKASNEEIRLRLLDGKYVFIGKDHRL